MEELRGRAFRIYLQHALSCALAVDAVRTQRKGNGQDGTGMASARWVRYCRRAQSACGVLGLVAIDRAESSLQSWLRSDSCFEWTGTSAIINVAQKLEASARCYVNALICQMNTDSSNAELWSYSGAVYDQVNGDKFCLAREYRTGIDDRLSMWRRSAIKSDPRTAGLDDEIAELLAEISMKYRTGLAHIEVAAAQHSLPKTPTVERRILLGCAIAGSARYLESALEFTRYALECDTSGEKVLQALWRLCATHMRSAAEETVKLNDRRAAVSERSGHSVASLAKKLARAASTLQAVSSTAPGVDLAGVKGRLSDVFRHIDETVLAHNAPKDTAQMPDVASIERDIEKIISALLAMTPRNAPELRIVERCKKAAEKVNVDQSPAHPHIKLCWLNAAEQMRMATAAINDSDIDLYKLRSSLYEKIAQGPLTTAAEYSANSAHAPTAQSRDLWLQAAQALQETTLPLMKRCHSLRAYNTLEYTEAEADLVRRASQLAEAAACSQQVHSYQTAAPPCTLLRLHEAELQLRLTVLAWDERLAKAHRRIDRWHRCRELCMTLLYWCHHHPAVRCAALVAPDEPPMSAQQQQEAHRRAEQRVERAIWLCEALTVLAGMYASAVRSSEVIVAVERAMPALKELVNEVVEESDPDNSDFESVSLIGAVREAVRAFLSKSAEECLVWRAAAYSLAELQHCPVGKQIYNRLVLKAWDLRGMESTDAELDPLLLLPILPVDQNGSGDPLYTVHIGAAADALVESQHMREYCRLKGVSREGKMSASMSAAQFQQSAHYVRLGLLSFPGTQPLNEIGAAVKAGLEEGARAMLAGRRFAAAAQAAAKDQKEAFGAFLLAAKYIQLPIVYLSEDDDSKWSPWDVCSDHKLPIAEKTGERYASAARALLAGDRELYELWLKAAEATASTEERYRRSRRRGMGTGRAEAPGRGARAN
jgi:hypothetical protein